MAKNHINPDHFLHTNPERKWTEERNELAWKRAYLSLCDYITMHEECKELCVVMGVQGAGKSTWVQQNNKSKNTVYFDAALPRRKHRKKLLEIAKNHNLQTKAIYIDVELEVAKARNAQRNGCELVPETSLDSVFVQLESPSIEEGFDEVRVVVF